MALEQTISLGNFPLFPQFCAETDLAKCKLTKDQRRIPRREYDASPGYFTITLEDGIRGEATVTEHTALYRFTFPYNETANATTNHPVISLDLQDLAGTRNGNAKVTVDRESGRISGSSNFQPSFGTGTYGLHFCLDFSGPERLDTTIWDRAGPVSEVAEKEFGGWVPGGALVKFDSKPQAHVLARVGLSFMSVQQACQNSESEIPDYGFERVKKSAESAWRKKLEVVTTIPGGIDKDLEIIFWSGFYRTMLSPQDYTNENPLWNSSEPYFDSFYCIWDSFRAQHPFLTIVDPVEQSRMVRALLDIYKHEGKLPDCRMSLCKGLTQGGSNADVVIADGYLKKLQNVDWDLAYEAVVSDAEEEPAQWNYVGRGGLQSWKTLGFLPINDDDTLGTGLMTRSVSRTVEFAYNDFCIAQMAEGLNHMDDYQKYMKRARNWVNLYNPGQNSTINGVDTGFVGFLQPRYVSQIITQYSLTKLKREGSQVGIPRPCTLLAATEH